MDQRKKNLRAVQMSHLINEYFADSGDHPVRVSAERVPTLSLVPNDPHMESSKVVLNKHGWNPVAKPYAEPMQKASYKGDVPRPRRSILCEPNENHYTTEHLDSRLAAQLPDGYNVSSSVSSNDYISLRKKDFQPERNQHPPVTNGHNARTSQINIHANDSAHAQAPRYDNSQYVGRRTDASLNSVGHSHNNSPPLSPGVYRSDSSHESILKYDNSRGNFLQKDDQPIISAYTLGSSVKGSYLTARDRDFSIDRQTRAERIDPEGTLAENNDLLKRTKLGMKVRQHKDLKGQDGLEKLRQIIARQRHGKEPGGAEKREIEPSNWKSAAHPTNIPPVEIAGLHPSSSVAGASGKISDAGSDGYLSNDGHRIPTRSLHHNDDPIRPSKKARPEPRAVSIPRKVAQAPAPPSYRGFSEIVSHKTSAATDADRRLMTDATRKRGLDEPCPEPAGSRTDALTGVNRVEMQTSNQTTGITIQDGKPKKLVQFDKDLADKSSGRESSKKQVSPMKNAHVEPALQKKLTKPNKSDINVRSWRAGRKVVKQELGEFPKMSLSPPTKDSSPELHRDDFGMASQSNPLARSKSDDVHNRMMEQRDDNRTEHLQMKNRLKEKRAGAMETIVNHQMRHDIDDYRSEDKEDISDRSTQARDEIHEHQDQETDDAQNENDEDDDDNSISHEHHAEVKLPSKSKSLSSTRRIQKRPEPEKERDRKTGRDISYDKEEVKLYMAKQKAERKRKEKEEQMEKQRAEENRQRQLEELSKKQKESARLRSRHTRTNKGKERTESRENSTDSGGHRHGDVSSVELSSAEERSCERIQNSKNISEKTNQARFDQDSTESGTERKNDYNHRELRGETSELTHKSASTLHSSDTRMKGSETKSTFPKEMKSDFPSDVDSRKTPSSDIASSVTKDAVSWSQPSAHVTSSAIDSVHSRPGTDSRAERWATLAQSAQSLRSRLNDQANSFATALNSKVSLNKPAIPAADKFQPSAVTQPIRNVWVPTDSSAAVQTASVFLSNGYADNRDEEESDSTLTEDSVAQVEKPSLLHPMKFSGTNAAAAAAEPSSYRQRIVTKDQDRKNSDIERWITKREWRDSDMESTITGSMLSDTESNGKASVADSAAAALPAHLKDLRVDTVRDSDYMLKLKTMQQSHRATMLSLQAKSQQDLILASRRPLTQRTEMDSLRLSGAIFDNQSSFADQNRSYFPGASVHSASVLHVQSNYLPGSQFSVGPFSGKHGALESSEQEPVVHHRSLSKGSRSDQPDHQLQAKASFSSTAKRDRSQPEKGLDGSFDLDSSITEEEMERSLREVLPSERQRKRLRRDGSLTNVADQVSAKHVSESESFDAFSLNLVRDYLTQEQSRIQHQHSLLKLREQALVEKTKAELAWLEQQKQKSQKGCDDSYPAIRQKQKEVLEKHKKEETGLHILQDLTKQAMKMQQGSMTEIEKIAVMQHTAQQIKQELDRQNPRVRRWLDANELTLNMLSSDSESAASVTSGGKQLSERMKEAGVGFEDIAIPLSDTRNEDQKSLECATIDTSRSQSPQRENSVGLELTVDTSVLDLHLAQSASPMQEKIAHKLKIQLDKKYLTAREQKLRQRRMEAEKLLAWKNRLDREEEEVVQLEMEAAGKLPQKRAVSVGDSHDVMPTTTFESGLGSVHYKDCCTSPFHPSPIPSTENLQQGHLEQGLPQVTPPLKQEDLDSSKQMVEVINGSREAVVQAAEFDAAELSVVEVTDSVDAASLPNAPHKLSPEELRTSDLSELSNHRRRSSASETEESISIPISELTSDQSDIERQVRALKEELLRKKIEVENLRKRKKKEKLKAKEDSLKKKIELVDEEIEKLATMSPINFKDFGSAEPSLTSPIAELELSMHSIKEAPSEGRDAPREPVAAVCVEVPEKHLLVKDIPNQSTNILISTPKSDDNEIRSKGLHFSESSIEANIGYKTPSNASDFLDGDVGPAIASVVNKGATSGTDGSSPALGITDLDDFFDVTVNSISSRPVFKASEENNTKAGIEKDKQEDHNESESEELIVSLADGEKEDELGRSEKSAFSEASKDSLDSVSNRSRSSASAKSNAGKGTEGKGNEDILGNSNVDEASVTSKKSGKSTSSVESRNSRPSLSDKSHSVVSSRSDNKTRTRAARVAADLPGERNADGESLASDRSSRSISSRASKKSWPSLSDKSVPSVTDKSYSDDNIKQKVLEQAIDKAEEESEKSANSERSSRRSLSDNSKNSLGSKKTAPSSSSNVRSYAEDFSNGSRHSSKRNAPEHAPAEDEHTVCLSDAEEVRTEDDIGSSLSEDVGELESEDLPPKFQLDLSTKPVATSEISLQEVSSEKVKDPSKKSSSESIADLNDIQKDASILPDDAKDVSKTKSLSSDDNLMKERPPEFPSETDLQNESADQTSRSMGDSRFDADDRSLSGGGDSELERVISSAAAAVELFGEQSANALSVVSNDVVGARETSPDVLADKAVTGLVHEAISDVLAVKAKKETTSLVGDNDSNSLEAQQNLEQRTSPSFVAFDDWGDDGEFLDDDLDWSPARNTPPPPPYTEGPKDDSGSQKQPPSLRLPGLTVHPPEPAIVVPHTADELLPLADQVVDIFWQLRRCGESWDDVQPTQEYFGLDANAITLESSSRRMHKHLVFEVVAEFLRDMYREDEDDNSELYPLVPPRPTKWKQYYKEQDPPKTLDVLKPVVRLHVMHTVGQQVALQKVPRKWSTRRKDDGVDRVLVKELHEEEPEWVSYESDTVNIKLQLSEAIFQLLLTDTVHTLRNVQHRIAVSQLPEF